MQDPKSVTRLRQGDISTLKRLFKSNHSGAFALAFRLTKDREAADEIIRLAFKRLWKDREELDPLEVIFLRLLRYCYELGIEYRAENGVTGIALGARTAAGEKIAAELEDLPENLRFTYVLHIVDGYSIRELAHAFDKSEDEIREEIGSALVIIDGKLEADLQP